MLVRGGCFSYDACPVGGLRRLLVSKSRMTNVNYRRGRKKEYLLKERLEQDGYIVFRTSGSHGIADLIALKPRKEGSADKWPEIRLIQIKSSIHFKEETVTHKLINHLVIEWFQFPIKTKEWYAKTKRPIRRVHRFKSTK